MNEQPKIFWFEPIIFFFFGVFHLHRIWALADRVGYSEYWLSVLENRDLLYFLLVGVLGMLCVAGFVVFIRNTGSNYWWRWFYVLGGGYVLFDLFAILVGLQIWMRLVYAMFDCANPYWNIIWGAFIGLGLVSFILGILITKKILRR